jgi:hypothetical protein
VKFYFEVRHCERDRARNLGNMLARLLKALVKQGICVSEAIYMRFAEVSRKAKGWPSCSVPWLSLWKEVMVIGPSAVAGARAQVWEGRHSRKYPGRSVTAGSP